MEKEKPNQKKGNLATDIQHTQEKKKNQNNNRWEMSCSFGESIAKPSGGTSSG